METRAFQLEQRDLESDDTLRVRGRAVVYDALSEDLGGFRERFAPGALRRTLDHGRDVALLYSHDTQAVLASTRAGSLDLSEDDDGLMVDATLQRGDPDVERLAAKMRAGLVDKMSFGFRVVREDWEEDAGDLVRVVQEAQLIETSAVWLPAYTQTSLEEARRLDDVPIGALAGMPGWALDRIAEREGKMLSSWTEEQIDQAIAALTAIKDAARKDDKPGYDEADGDAEPDDVDGDEGRAWRSKLALRRLRALEHLARC